jgi:dolichol-phosphate mannosyltransferase
MLTQALIKFLFPDSAPPGITTTLLVITFFGSLNLFAVSILGEYIAKIFEEVKRRPHFIRRSIIRRGNVAPSDGEVGIFAGRRHERRV